MTGSMADAAIHEAPPGENGGDREFALSAVPAAATAPSYKIGVVLLGANISLPTLVMGGELGVKLGFDATVTACIWAGMILALLAGTCAYVGARSRLTTYVMIIRAFGQRGGEIINLLLAMSAIGWFGVVVVLFAETMIRMTQASALFASPSLWVISGSILMAYTTIVGFRALDILSNIMLPLKLGLIVWALAVAIRTYGTGFTEPMAGAVLMDEKTAVSFIVGGWVVGAIIAPDFSRFARSPVGVGLACAFALGVGYPLVLLGSSVPAILTGEKDMLMTMGALGMGFAALSIIMLASWTNGATNLYCASLMLSTVFRRFSRKALVWLSCVLGLVLGLAGITDQIVPYLVLLSAVVPPIAGVYLPRFFLDQHPGDAPLADADWQPGAIAALLLGIAAAAIGHFHGGWLTGLVAIDSLLVSSLSYLAFEWIRRAAARRATARA
ncbi:cytosine permease [Sphingomonas colocasiae]|uniref:Cytosine permease n=1 Tax=Sphingomonas colocasiae TaxID=1848973 RepID=A0ABS7PX70_9SPHN|nr:cytosine permease [Sphingomonas colocasiae]MBY8824942.1 cytosine permease [Sphingomonas colocasiae]